MRTIEAVARQIHPQDRNPLWKFTIPEALALVERVSADLRPFVVDNIPLGDQLTVGQVLKIYGWRSAIGMAEKAYDIWRLIRLVNPVTAAAQEAREQITKHLYANVRDQMARQLAGAYVREVGRAAIDLYGGRLAGDAGAARRARQRFDAARPRAGDGTRRAAAHPHRRTGGRRQVEPRQRAVA